MKFLPALVAWKQAQELCIRCPAGCSAYHRVQPALRRLGLAAEPNDHRSFLFPAITATLKEIGPHILISGAVDDAMAEMVLQAGLEAGCSPCLTIVDRCATSLAVIRASFRNITTAHSDILDYRASRRFDLIVTHSFLGYFGPEERPRLMTTWFDALRPGGRLVTVARLRPQGEARTFSAASANRFAREVQRRAIQHEREMAIPAGELADAALAYALNRPMSFPLHSVEDLDSLLCRAGFRIRRIGFHEPPARVHGIDGPALPRAGKYAEVIAERP